MFKHGCVFLLVALGSACSSSSDFPTAPSPSITPSMPPRSIAALTPSTFTVTRSSFQPFSDWVYYDVKLRLTETGGQSGATLNSVGLSYVGAGTDWGCAGSRHFKISAGETWEMDSLDYCSPEVVIHKSVGTEVSSVTLTVTFTDDNGVIDSLGATVNTK